MRGSGVYYTVEQNSRTGRPDRRIVQTIYVHAHNCKQKGHKLRQKRREIYPVYMNQTCVYSGP